MSKYKAMKFEVGGTEHSKAIQERLFALGYKWNGGATVLYADDPYLYTTYDGYIASGSGCWAYQKDPAEAHTLDSLYKKERKTLKVPTLEDRLVYADKFLMVGCQTIEREDAITIARWILEVTKDD